MKYLLLLLIVCGGCFTKKSLKKSVIDNLKCNIVDIKEFEHSYRLTCINDFSKKSIIVSLKNNQQKSITETADTISLNNSYTFKVTQIKPRVSTMEQLGAFIIIESDTLWKAPTYKDIPPTYLAHNTTGLFFLQK